MYNDVNYALLLPVILAPLLVVSLFLIRRKRIQKWKEILFAPPLKGETKKLPSWTKNLPKGVVLDSKTELHEILYRHLRAQPKLPTSDTLQMAVEERYSAETGEVPVIKPAKLTSEDKIQTLIGAAGVVPTALPSEALAQNVVVNLVNVLKGNKKLSLGLEHALWDSLGVGGGFAGAKLGGLFVLMLAPALVGATALVAPVGIMIGAWGGTLIGKKLGTRFKARRYLAAAKKLQRTSRNFQKWFLSHFPDFLEKLDQEYFASLETFEMLLKNHQTAFGRFFFPNLMTVFYQVSLKRLRVERVQERRRYRILRVKVRALDPLRFATVLEQVDSKAARSQPGLLEHYEAYQEALQDLKAAAGSEPPVSDKPLSPSA